MRGDAVLRHLVHLLRPNLHLHRLAVRPYHGSMQAAIQIVLRIGDVIVKLARNRTPVTVHNAQRCVAVRNCVNDDAESVDVVDLVERHFLAPHFAVDPVNVLRPPVDLGSNAGLFEHLGQRGLRLFHPVDPLGPLLVHRLRQVSVGDRLQVAKTEVLKLPLDLPDPQPVRQRRKDLQRLARNPPPLVLGVALQRPHIVDPVRQLDQHHPDVFHHRQEHLAQALGLLIRHAVPHLAQLLDAVQLRHAVYQLGNVLVEILLQVGNRVSRVLHHVVQKRRRQRIRVQLQFRQDARHVNRVQDIRLAGHARLLAMRVARDQISPQNPQSIVRAEVTGQLAIQLFQRLDLVQVQQGLEKKPAVAYGRNSFQGNAAQ